MGADAAQDHRVAVRFRIGDALRTGHAASTANVFDDDLLAEQFAHALGDNAADGVLRSAGGERNDHCNRACWEILGSGRSGQSQCGKGRGIQNLFHCFLHETSKDLRGDAPMVKRGRVGSADLDNLLRELVQPVAGPISTD